MQKPNTRTFREKRTMAIRLINCIFPPGNSWSTGNYDLVFTGAGNLELWNKAAGQLLWQSRTSNAISLTMQEDGNLVMYGSNGIPIWASNTSGNNGASLVIQDDGNLVIYSRTDEPLWATNTNPEQLSEQRAGPLESGARPETLQQDPGDGRSNN